MNYHAHIYWSNAEERSTAMEARTVLHDNGCALGRIWDIPIGPHPLPMYQVMFDSTNYDCIVDYLLDTKLTVLVHEDIGVSHVRDHTEGAIWLGRGGLELNLNFLKAIDNGEI